MKRLIIAIGVLIVLITPLYIRALQTAEYWYFRGSALLERGELRQGAAALRKSVSWNAPLTAYSPRAAVWLYELAQESDRPVEEKLLLLRELRRGISSSRGTLPFSSFQELLSDTDAQIEQLSVRKISDSVRQAVSSERSAQYQLMAQFFFWGWVLGAVCLIWKGFSSEGRIIRRPLLVSVGTIVVCYGFWCFALLRA